MIYDIIILSFSKTKQHEQITQNCIDSLLKAKNKIGVNIIVLESYLEDITFKGAKTVFYKEEKFNYNRSMNKGFSLTTNKYVFFCNNDLLFHDGWADQCYYAFNMGFDSISPYCPITHPRFTISGDFILSGYQVGFHVAGWCIGVNREMFVKLGGFNEAVSFWYSDNLYAEQLKIAKVKHGLVCSGFVSHLDLGSQTLKTLDSRERMHLTAAQKSKYDKEVKRLYA